MLVTLDGMRASVRRRREITVPLRRCSMRASGSFDLGNHAPLLRVKNSALPADEFTQIITGQDSGEQSPRDAPRRTPQSVALVLSSESENLPAAQSSHVPTLVCAGNSENLPAS
jgi:hypothetical protein